ncbi:hypothetical protein [Lysinibacillus sp. Bpr_S20]|uniref:hypothetical protein n=1 Tax=Lysinibacillus sp. Bpr_S20 TaxID=2933964 RepID=UPI0020111C34|nr:hypothetical protein [Lysinibacillus sp. Bpr_S20]MCL1700814.1 hypothetical protein [Lysinibacillus sp. Bpr_S20]
MKCIICSKSTSYTDVKINDFYVHPDCFFDNSIPAPPSKMDKDFLVKNDERKQAIHNRTVQLMNIYGAENE